MSHDSKLMPRVGVGALSSPLEVGAERGPQLAAELADKLNRMGCTVVELGLVDEARKASAAGRKAAEAHVQAVAFAGACWFEDYLALDLLEECRVPVLLWSVPGLETGALCGAQQLSAYLQQLDMSYCCIYGSFEQAEAARGAEIFLRAAALKKELRRARVGYGGHRVAGMTEVAANEIALKKAVGPRIVPLDLPGLLARAAEVPGDQAEGKWQDVVRRSGRCRVTTEAGLDSMRVYLAVHELVCKYELDALTIGCYPHLMGRVCLAASLLADEGVPLGCEGDVNGAVGQLMLTRLTGEPTHNTDWLEPLEDGTVVFSHCGSGSFSLAEKQDDITLGPVRLMEQGVCALFPARPGAVTLVNLVPRAGGYQVAVLQGEAVRTEMVFPGNPLRVRLPEPAGRVIEWVHAEGIGHHWMVGYGDVSGEIRSWASLIGGNIRLVEL